MADAPHDPDPAAEVPSAVEARPSRIHIHIVWIIPIVAAVVGAWIAVQSWLEAGPEITIRFDTAEGIEPGKTRIRHKSVDIGTVRGVRLSEDNKTVIVTAEMDRASSHGFLVEDTRFWVVRPRIAGGQVSGLGTLLAGSYIGSDPGQSSEERRDFIGLENPPPITSDLPGTQYALRAPELGSLDIGSPIYYRGVLAGRVTSTEVPPGGEHVELGIFVHAPFDRFVNAQTRFWNASGVDLALDASGVKLQTQSLVTLLVGGVSFEMPPEQNALPPVAPHTRFPLWDSRAEAFRERVTEVETFTLRFTQSVRGLAVGAPVDLRGITVGEVRQIDFEFDRKQRRLLTRVEVHLWPERLRSRNSANGRGEFSTLTPKERVKRLVERGMRGQLRSANLLTGQLFVALDFFPKAAAATVDLAESPPEIPTIPGGLGELQESLANIVAKLEKVPFDAIGQDLRKALATLESTLAKADALMGQLSGEVAPELRATLEQARRSLAAAEHTLAADSPVQGNLRETLMEVTRAAESLRSLVDYLERHPEALIRGRRGEPR